MKHGRSAARSRFLFCLISFLVVSALIAPAAAPAHPLQQISGDEIRSIASDGKDGHTWWATVSPIDPARVTASLLEKTEGGDVPGDPWTAVALPGFVEELIPHGYNENTRELWFLKRFVLEKPSAHLALRLGKIDDKDVVYVNGVRIASTGQWDDPRPAAYDLIRVYDIPGHILRPGVNVVLVHVQGYFPGEMGMVRDKLEIGSYADLKTEILTRDFLELLLLACYFTAGSYFLFLFLRRRTEREHLIFALFVYVLVAYQAMKLQFKFAAGIDYLIIKKFEYLLLYAIFPLFYTFLRYYYDPPRTRPWKIWNVVVALGMAAHAFFILHILFTDDARAYWVVQKNIAQPVWVLFIGGMLGILVSGVRRKNPDAIYMLAGFGMICIGTATDILSSRGLFSLPPIMSYIFAGFMLSLAVILANRFVRVNEEVEDLNANLETKVTERTQQLRQSLDEIRELKIRQDGDYFLTSLLIQPLGGDHNESNSVRTEIVQRQMKQFTFRKWQAEIGGDHSAIHPLKLRDRSYTAFINADAMGKSIQGAGGVLVLGTVFQALITRTQLASEVRNRHPEQWLKGCLLELQNTFVVFDGSMLLSAIVGLVDDECGLVYWINSDHPRPVLLRNGRASFVDPHIMRKIGVPDMEADFKVDTLQLQPGDVLILGSDGRDDLDIGVGPDGQRIINDDESIFLKTVQQAEGHLDQITNILFSFGSQMDDLSLVRIAYMEDAPVEPSKTWNDFGGELKEAALHFKAGRFEDTRSKLAQIAANENLSSASLLQVASMFRALKDFPDAAVVLGNYLERNPADEEALAAYAVMLKMAGRKSEAIDAGERCRLRNPRDIRNLLNLADAYRTEGDIPRARTILGEAKSVDAAHAGIEKLERMLSGRD